MGRPAAGRFRVAVEAPHGRDHQDLGLCLRGLEAVGAANYFHSRYREPDPSRQSADDRETPTISRPNHRSSTNGDYQRIRPQERDHPHEGAVGAQECGADGRIIATGTSRTTGRVFNVLVALESRGGEGRALAHSSFHHFADCNWALRPPRPSLVSEAPGDGMLREPLAAEDIRRCVENAALWLAGAESGSTHNQGP